MSQCNKAKIPMRRSSIILVISYDGTVEKQKENLSLMFGFTDRQRKKGGIIGCPLPAIPRLLFNPG
jgi:hypothetical protein